MNAQEAALLVKAAGQKKVKELAATLTEGEYDVSILLSVEGSLRQGAGYDQSFPAKISPWKMFLVALNKLNGVTISAIMREAENVDAEAEKGFRKQVDEVRDSILSATSRACKGKLTASGIRAEVIEAEAVKATAEEVVAA